MLFQITPFLVVVAFLNFIFVIAIVVGLALFVRWLVWGRARHAAAMRSLDERVERIEAKLDEGEQASDVPKL